MLSNIQLISLNTNYSGQPVMSKKSGSDEALKNPELVQAEKDGQARLHAYFREKHGRQSELSRAAGMQPATLSRMASGDVPITLRAAIRIEVGSGGKLRADELCPAEAEMLKQYIQLQAA